jgi:hypothetical protein
MARCAEESDRECRLLLATAFGEVGAIDVKYLGSSGIETSVGYEESERDNYKWILSQAPWRSRPPRYELQLVTKFLGAALKAATTSGDQHKIGYTLQQLLLQLDASAREKVTKQRSEIQTNTDMSPWLQTALTEAKVHDAVSPFWRSEFIEVCMHLFAFIFTCARMRWCVRH